MLGCLFFLVQTDWKWGHVNSSSFLFFLFSFFFGGVCVLEGCLMVLKVAGGVSTGWKPTDAVKLIKQNKKLYSSDLMWALVVSFLKHIGIAIGAPFAPAPLGLSSFNCLRDPGTTCPDAQLLKKTQLTSPSKIHNSFFLCVSGWGSFFPFIIYRWLSLTHIHAHMYAHAGMKRVT